MYAVLYVHCVNVLYKDVVLSVIIALCKFIACSHFVMKNDIVNVIVVYITSHGFYQMEFVLVYTHIYVNASHLFVHHPYFDCYT